MSLFTGLLCFGGGVTCLDFVLVHDWILFLFMILVYLVCVVHVCMWGRGALVLSSAFFFLFFFLSQN